MTLPLEKVDPAFTGAVPLHAARNGLGASGRTARALARAANFLLGRSMAIIPGKYIRPGTGVRNDASELALWRTRYRASPNGTTLISTVHLLPTNDTANVPEYYLKIDGVATTSRTHNRYCAADGQDEYALGTATVPGSFLDTMEVTVTAGTKHTVELWTKNKCRVLGWQLREKPRYSLTPGTDTVVDYSHLAPLADLRSQDIQYLLQTAMPAIQAKLRGVALSWNVDDPASPITLVGDAAFHDLWVSNCYHGVPLWYRNTYMNEIATLRSIPCYAWVYAERSAGAGTGTVDFNITGGPSISVNGAAGIYDATGTLDENNEVIYLAAEGKAPVGTTIKVYAAGLIPLVGT